MIDEVPMAGRNVFGSIFVAEQNEYDVDAASVNGDSRNASLTPEPNAMQEVRVDANSFSAENYRNSGALVEFCSLVTASVTSVLKRSRKSTSKTLGPAITFVALAAVAVAAGNQSAELPEGKGRAALLRACVGCHEIDVVTTRRYTETGWRKTVDNMVEHGAELSEPEIAEVTAYLAKNFGKVNINKAGAAQLADALGLSEKEAGAIVAYREQNGDIKNLEQLKSVPGVSPDKIQAKAAAIAFRD